MTTVIVKMKSLCGFHQTIVKIFAAHGVLIVSIGLFLHSLVLEHLPFENLK